MSLQDDLAALEPRTSLDNGTVTEVKDDSSPTDLPSYLVYFVTSSAALILGELLIRYPPLSVNLHRSVLLHDSPLWLLTMLQLLHSFLALKYKGHPLLGDLPQSGYFWFTRKTTLTANTWVKKIRPGTKLSLSVF
jgi:hypothetical protein